MCKRWRRAHRSATLVTRGGQTATTANIGTPTSELGGTKATAERPQTVHSGSRRRRKEIDDASREVMTLVRHRSRSRRAALGWGLSPQSSSAAAATGWMPGTVTWRSGGYPIGRRGGQGATRAVGGGSRPKGERAALGTPPAVVEEGQPGRHRKGPDPATEGRSAGRRPAPPGRRTATGPPRRPPPVHRKTPDPGGAGRSGQERSGSTPPAAARGKARWRED